MTTEVTNPIRPGTQVPPQLIQIDAVLHEKIKRFVEEKLGFSVQSIAVDHKYSIEIRHETGTTITAEFKDKIKRLIDDYRLTPQARQKFQTIVAAHASSKVDVCSDQIIPASDKFAVYRNGYKLGITLIALILTVLTVSGIATPVALAILAGAISLIGLSILIILHQQGKITGRDACMLAFMTIASTFATFFGGETAHYVLLGIYALSVMFQGTLFAGPQGLGAWGKGGYNKYQIAKEVGDKKHMISAAFQMNSGAMSAVEGTVWVFMGFLMLTAALHGFIPGIPEILPQVLPWITTTLFLGIFNVSYSFMIGTGFRDLRIQEKFHRKITELFKDGNREQCIDALMYLRQKLTGKCNEESTEQKLMKRVHRLRKLVDGDAFELLQIHHIDDLINRLSQNDPEALKISQLYIRDIIKANERNIDLSKSQIKIGFAGLIVGTILSLLEEFTNAGSVIGMPYVGDVTPLPQTALDALSTASTVADCGFWAWLNHMFKRCLDAPDGRTDEEKQNLAKVFIDQLHRIMEVQWSEKSQEQLRSELERIYSFLPEELRNQLEKTRMFRNALEEDPKGISMHQDATQTINVLTQWAHPQTAARAS